MNPTDITGIGPQRTAPAGNDRGSLERLTAQELAREFESVMIVQMLRQMRQTVLSESDDSGLYGSAMLETIDVELARQLSQAGGVGIAAVMGVALARQTAAASASPMAEPETSGAVSRPETVPMSVVPSPDSVPEKTADPMAHLTSPYGWRSDPFTGAARFHGGIDLRAAYGETVPAAGAGRVVDAGERGAYGLTVLVEHASGIRTRYAHLSALSVAPGDRVAEGQELGRVGQSGRATGPHLHFEIIRNGKRIDPEGVLALDGNGIAGLKLAHRSADYLPDRRTSPTDSGADHEN